MPSYNRLTADNRIELYALNKAGLKQNAIAAQLNVSPSTISRELRRNSGLRGYRPKQADRLACARRSQACSRRISQATWQRVDTMIEDDWSPEQISGHLKASGLPGVSPVSVRNGSIDTSTQINLREAHFTATYAVRKSVANAVVQSSVAGKSLGGSALRNAHKLLRHAHGSAIGKLIPSLADRAVRCSSRSSNARAGSA